MYDFRNLQDGTLETMRELPSVFNSDYDLAWGVYRTQHRLYMDIRQSWQDLRQEFESNVSYDRDLIDELILMGISLDTAISLARI